MHIQTAASSPGTFTEELDRRRSGGGRCCSRGGRAAPGRTQQWQEMDLRAVAGEQVRSQLWGHIKCAVGSAAVQEMSVWQALPAAPALDHSGRRRRRRSAVVDVEVPLEEAWALWEDRELIPNWMPWITSVKARGGRARLALRAAGRGLGGGVAARRRQPTCHHCHCCAGAGGRPSHVALDAVLVPVRAAVGVQLAGPEPGSHAAPEDPLAQRARQRQPGRRAGGGQPGADPVPATGRRRVQRQADHQLRGAGAHGALCKRARDELVCVCGGGGLPVPSSRLCWSHRAPPAAAAPATQLLTPVVEGVLQADMQRFAAFALERHRGAASTAAAAAQQ